MPLDPIPDEAKLNEWATTDARELLESLHDRWQEVWPTMYHHTEMTDDLYYTGMIEYVERIFTAIKANLEARGATV